MLIFVSVTQGNKKGPVKRWDFESEDDYNKYQSAREAMPKLVWYSILVVCCGILVVVWYTSCVLWYTVVY